MALHDRTPPTVDEYLAYAERFSNWGRWGDDDELGTLNHISGETKQAASALVQVGRSVSCANPIATAAVLPDQRRNSRPADHPDDGQPRLFRRLHRRLVPRLR